MTRAPAFLVFLWAAVAAGAAWAQQPQFAKPTPFVGPEQPTIGKELKLHASDLLDLNLTVEDKGASLTYAPLLYGLREYHSLWSELRFKFVQADGRVSFGAGFVINPLSPRGRRGVQAWNDTKGKSRESQIQVLEEKQERARQDLATLRAALAASSEATQQIDLLRRIAAITATLESQAEEIAALNKEEDKLVVDRTVRYHEALQKIRRPVVSVLYTAQLFEPFSATAIDVDSDGLRDNARHLRSHRLSSSVDVRVSSRLSVSGLMAWTSQFGTAEEASARSAVWVGGWTIGGVAKVLNAEYKETDDYKKTLFVPAVVWGFAHEFGICNDGQDCPDATTRRHSFTLFLDIKLKPAAQFRIGFPFTTKTVADTDGKTEVGAIAAFTIQVGAPK